MSNTLEGSPHLTTEQKRALAKRLLREKAAAKGLSATLRLLPELFELQVDRHPDAIAITFEDQTATYRELDRRANQVAHRLRRLGVGPEVRVGLCLRRSIGMVVGLLGVLKAGGAYVPLDPDFPADRIALMLDDSRLSVLLTQKELRHTLPETAASRAAVLCLDADRAAIERESDRRVGTRPAPENLAYVIYTSGSTGRPKGVQVTHRALANFLESFHSLLGMTERDELLAVTTLSFDIAALELLLPVVTGARLTLVSRDEASDGTRLKRRLADPAVTFLQATPATWRLLLEADWAGSPALTLLCGGEALPRVLADRLLDKGKALWNLYGPTETTIWSSAHRVEPGAGSISIGRPIARTQMYVLDARFRPVPAGVVGELYIGGAGLARGYLDRPGLTAERFLPDPVGNEPGGRIYRTGDLARWLPDGRLECLGRIDHQVKIRGYRIELGEIEASLAKYPGIRQVAVVAREDTPGDRRLVAYLVGEMPETGELRNWLRRALPEYMVPAVYHGLDALPLTPNGKIDRGALPAPEPMEAGHSRALVPPRGPIEEAIVPIWAEVLGQPVSRVGVHESFFDLGGHSLLAAQLMARLRDLFEVELPLRTLFEDPTVAGVARWIEEGTRAGQGLELPPLVPAERPSEVPLSFAQQTLWVHDRLAPGQATFNMPVAVRVTGPLDVAAFERSLAEMVRRHEVLRTSFATVQGRPVQVVAESIALPLMVVDLRGLESSQHESEVRRLAAEEARQPFDLARGPLVRVRLVWLTDDDHVILLTMHHIIGDGWSFGVAAGELAALYRAFRRGAPSPLSALPIQYADYALWQRGWLQGAYRDRLVDYWSARLAGVTPLELPTDRPRPPIRTARGAIETFTIPATVSEPLAALCRTEGVTPFMLLLAAFQTLLHRYSGQDDIVVGSPVANRGRSEVEGLIGYFVNMLALRTDLSGDPSFRALLGRVREAALGAYEHQDLPFEMVLEALQLPHDPSRTPVFQVMFVLQNNRLPEVAGTELSVTPLTIDQGTGTAKFDLTLEVEESAAGFLARFEYDTDVFDSATIVRMSGHFQALLESILAQPDQRLSSLPMATDEEGQQLIARGSGARSRHAEERCVHRLLEAQAETTPDASAVVFEGRTLTYRELNDRSNQLAHELRGRGIGPDVLVGIGMTRSLDLIVGLLGVLKAGAAYVPLDPAYPPDRLAAMQEDSRFRLLLTQEHLRTHWPEHQAEVLYLDSEWEAISRRPAMNLDGGADRENVAYVIYTSGSTGRPKGVMVTHRALANFLQSFRSLLGMTARDELAAVTTLSFDIAALELFLPLVVGAQLALVSRDEASDGVRLKQRLDSGDVTYLQATPATWRLLLDAGWAGSPDLTLLCGGEALPRVLADRLLERGKELWNLYGPTETTIWSSTEQVAPGTGPVSIGRPIARTQLYVLDPRFEPVPVGVVGELYIGGAGLARGYLNRPGLTAERFLPDPVGNEPGGRLYRTGDLARWLPDGRLECLGRIDHQVKIRGYRIELGEIEASLAKYPGIRQVAVVAREDTPGDRRLVAYLVGEMPETGELRNWLRRALPEYMVPAVYHGLDALPLTPNGKIDRGALPAPEPIEAGQARALVPPRGPIEEAIAPIWAEVLGQPVSRVGIHESFFDLGGHSLLAAQLMSRLRDLFGVDLPLRTLFEDPTVAGVARWIEEGRRAGQGLELPPLLPAERPSEVPPSFAQQSLWFLDQLSPGQATFNMPVAVRVTGPLDVAAFERSVAEMVRRHEVLRTSFASVEGRPVQVVAESIALPLMVVDLRGHAASQHESEVRRLAMEEARQPFDLARGPLVRARLVRLGEVDNVILLTMHHIIGDGWSFGVAAGELAALYRAFRRGGPSPLPALPIQYADYALWQRGWLQGAYRDRLVDYWTARLAGVTPLELPTDRPRPPIRTAHGAIETFTIPATVSEPLAALCRTEGVTPFMLLLAAFQTLLHRYSGQDDIVVGSPVANRGRSEVEGLIGYFVNMLALRTDLSGDPSFRALLGRVREVALDAYEHQDLPFEMVVEALQPPRDPSRTPLFQVMFVLQNNRLPDVAGTELSYTQWAMDQGTGTGTAKFDLTLVFEESAGGLAGGLEYNTDLFDAATIVRMIGHLANLLESIAANPDRPLAELPWLAVAERQLVLETWSAASPPLPARAAEDGIHQRFEAHAERAPDAVALVYGAERVTYRELDARSNRMARRLVGLGVGPETLVGIYSARSPEMMAGLIGVLKAGCAYMPLDPHLPSGRLATLMEEAGIGVVLAQEQLVATLPACAAAILTLEDEASDDDGSVANPAPSSANLAYVIYTSGSTGRPKGVMVEHASLLEAARAWEECYGLAPGMRHLQAAGFGFDVFTGDWVRALTTGGTLISCPREALLDPSALAALLSTERIDCVELVPAVAEALASELERTRGTLAPLRLLAVGSDTLQSELFARLRRLAGPSGRVVNSYGLTETTIDSTFYEEDDTGSALLPGTAAPIGRPFGATRVYLLDARLGPLPVGVAGELYIGGAGVARGYRGHSGATAARFLPDPFGPPGGRLYRTGDRGRWREGGILELLGRTDHQVKVRGFRIELGEVESALRRHPAVRDAVVAAREDSRGQKRLVGYVVPRPDEELGLLELRRWLQHALPEPMVPSAFVKLDTLPLSSNGKIDRDALPEPGPTPLDEGAEYLAPRSPLEETLARVWAEVLEVERVGVHDDFFDLGGHSLQSVQLSARLTAALNRPVSVKTVFQAPTVAAMADVLEREAARPGLSSHQAGEEPSELARWLIGAEPGVVPDHVTIEERPLLGLFATGELAPVDSVAIGYYPASILRLLGFDRDQVIREWFRNRPMITGVRETPLGRIGTVAIPRFDDQLYHDRDDLLAVLGDAVRLSRQIGASTVSLTGLLPSATGYGKDLVAALAGQDLPRITTGHATTTSAVVLTIRRALEEGGRALTGERVAIIGLGSVGLATLRLLLSSLPHPAALTLCDVYAKGEDLEAVRREVTGPLGYRGEVRLLASRHEVPAELYESSLIIGATNVAEILDIDRVAPGTIVVEYSASHLFRADRALRRFLERRDILISEGGVLAAQEPLPLMVHSPQGLDPWLKAGLVSLVARTQAREITGCVLSGLLSARFTHLEPTIGMIDRRTALDHYQTLNQLGFESARLHLDDVPLEAAFVQEFRHKHGNSNGRMKNPTYPVSQI